MKPDKIFMIAIGVVPEFQKTIIEKNKSFAMCNDVDFELLTPDKKTCLLPAFQSDVLRFDVCKSHDKYLYVDWDVLIKFLPDFNSIAGCGVYRTGYKDGFVLWSGIDQSGVFNDVIKNKNSSAKNYYRALNMTNKICTLSDNWYVNFQTGLGR
jgi:hypothetical protein